MQLKKETHKLQSELAEYCRTGESVVIQGAKQERLFHYRRLIRNVVYDVLQSAYPITQSLIGEEAFNDLCYNFFVNHNPQNPQYWKMPYELVEFCNKNGYDSKLNIPFLTELLYFEWLEIEVHSMPDGDVLPHHESGDLLSGIPVLNPDHKLIHFKYPVHRKIEPNSTLEPANYFVLIYRAPVTGVVKFLELSPVMAILVEVMADELIGEDALRKVAKTLSIPENTVLTEGAKILTLLKSKQVVLGSR